MSRYEIAVTCTPAQWEEICDGFNQFKIAWPPTNGYGVECADYQIISSHKWSRNPFHDGSAQRLSGYYPTAVFYCSVKYEDNSGQEKFWLLNGEAYFQKPDEQELKEAVHKSGLRFEAATATSAQGVNHTIELMPNGKIAYEGQNVFGECDVLGWKDMKAIACGDWHTVGLTSNGKLLACGSNANGQCDMQLFGQNVKQFSCGRYHTAILYENGKVSVRGALESMKTQGSGGIPSKRKRYTDLMRQEFIIPVLIEINGAAYAGRGPRFEYMQVGDVLTMRADWNNPYYAPVAIEVFNLAGESLGYLNEHSVPLEDVAMRLNSLIATVQSVTPLSARRKNARYPLMTVILEKAPLESMASSEKDNDNSLKKTEKIEGAIGFFRDVWLQPWENIVAIRSIHDAIIAVDATGQVYCQGYHGLDDQAFSTLINNLGTTAQSTPLPSKIISKENQDNSSLGAKADDEDSLKSRALRIFGENMQGYSFAYILYFIQKAGNFDLSEEDQERLEELLDSKSFHRSLGTDTYLFAQLVKDQNTTTLKRMIKMFILSAERLEFVNLLVQVLKDNPGDQDVLCKSIQCLETLFKISLDLQMDSAQELAGATFSEDAEDAKSDFTSEEATSQDAICQDAKEIEGEKDMNVDLEGMLKENLLAYCLAYVIGSSQMIGMVELSEEDQKRKAAMLASRAFHKSIGTDLYLYSKVLSETDVEGMEQMFMLFAVNADKPEFAELVEKALKTNPGFQDVIAKILIALEGVSGVKIGLDLNRFTDQVSTVLSDDTDDQDEHEDILSRAAESIENNTIGYSLKFSLIFASELEAKHLNLKEEEELVALVRSDQLRKALGTDQLVEEMMMEQLEQQVLIDLIAAWPEPEHEVQVQSFFQAALDNLPGQGKLLRKLFDRLAEEMEYPPGFYGTKQAMDKTKPKDDDPMINKAAVLEYQVQDKFEEPRNEVYVDSLKAFENLREAVKSLQLDEELAEKHLATLQQQKERKQKENEALEKARLEAMKAGKGIDDDINMFVTLHNEEILHQSDRAQEEFYEIYEDDFLSMTQKEVIDTREKIQKDMKDPVKARGFQALFMERDLEKRFIMSAKNLFNVYEHNDLERCANLAVHHSSRWFKEEELPWLHQRMQEELQQIRESMHEQIKALDERWVFFDTAKEMLRPHVSKAGGKEPTNNVFEHRHGSHRVLLQLATPGMMQMTMNLPGAMAWFWGVPILDIWNQACKSLPYAADGISEEIARQSVEAAFTHAKAECGKITNGIEEIPKVAETGEASLDAASQHANKGRIHLTAEPESEHGTQDEMAELPNFHGVRQNQHQEMFEQTNEHVKRFNEETERKKQALEARKAAATAEVKNAVQPDKPAKKGCYIATAVYGSYDAPEVMTLRCFRDQKLDKSWAGRQFIRVYYRLSPSLASWLQHWPKVNAWVRRRLDRFVQHLRGSYKYLDRT